MYGTSQWITGSQWMCYFFFDKVPHVYLLKLKMVGIDGSLLSWIRDYLTNRRQRCIIEGCVSGWLPVTSGVPQGTILGPLLFLLYINDIADNLTSKMALFGDDCVLSREVQIREDQLELQNDLTKLIMWSTRWQMTFNPEKCEVLELGRVKSTSYFLNGQKLSVVAKHKHLGVVLSTKLSWSSHIDNAVAKARKVWGTILRTTSFTNLLWFQYLNMHHLYGAHTPRKMLKSLSWCRGM